MQICELHKQNILSECFRTNCRTIYLGKEPSDRVEIDEPIAQTEAEKVTIDIASPEIDEPIAQTEAEKVTIDIAGSRTNLCLFTFFQHY